MEETKKYRLTDETIEHDGHTLHRIECVTPFGDVKAGDKGGFIEKEGNLSQHRACWVDGDAKVFGDAVVFGNAKVSEEAQVYDHAKVYGNAVVSSSAQVSGCAWVLGNASVGGSAQISGRVELFGDAHVFDNAQVTGQTKVYDARVSGEARVYDHAKVYGKAEVSGNSEVSGHAEISDDARIFGKAHVGDNAEISFDAQVFGDARVSGHARVSSGAKVFGHAAVSENAWVTGNAEVSGFTNVRGWTWIKDSDKVGGLTGLFERMADSVKAAMGKWSVHASDSLTDERSKDFSSLEQPLYEDKFIDRDSIMDSHGFLHQVSDAVRVLEEAGADWNTPEIAKCLFCNIPFVARTKSGSELFCQPYDERDFYMDTSDLSDDSERCKDVRLRTLHVTSKQLEPVSNIPQYFTTNAQGCTFVIDVNRQERNVTPIIKSLEQAGIDWNTPEIADCLAYNKPFTAVNDEGSTLRCVPFKSATGKYDITLKPKHQNDNVKSKNNDSALES